VTLEVAAPADGDIGCRKSREECAWPAAPAVSSLSRFHNKSSGHEEEKEEKKAKKHGIVILKVKGTTQAVPLDADVVETARGALLKFQLEEKETLNQPPQDSIAKPAQEIIVISSSPEPAPAQIPDVALQPYTATEAALKHMPSLPIQEPFPSPPKQKPTFSPKRGKTTQPPKRATRNNRTECLPDPSEYLSTARQVPGKVYVTPYFSNTAYKSHHPTPPAEYESRRLSAQERQQLPVEPAEYLYFAYGTELARSKMIKLYPGAEFLSLAKLEGYKFFVNESGKVSCMAASHFPDHKGNCEVWGFLYCVSERDIVEIEGKGYAKERNQSLLDLPVTSFTKPKLGWTGREKEEDLTRQGVVPAKVLVSCDFEYTKGLSGLSMEKVFGGESCEIQNGVTNARLNTVIVDLSVEWCPSVYIQETLRKWVAPPMNPYGVWF
jgi:hypothetical protein